ncbi:MAG: hypothetical protein GOV02_02975 [Candidatus Aenigmarchaeota archaeon]|nr:hypothetical protein [Candidatus Aenigmarchaeota archaeon]
MNPYKEINHNYCDGCYAKGNVCSNYYNDDGNCPCGICVVKPMCYNICDDHDKWDIDNEE